MALRHAANPLVAYRSLLSHQSYRCYLASSTLGAFASAVQFLGQGWLILHIAPGGTMLVVFLIVRFATKSLFAIPAGMLADRLPRATVYAWMRVLSGVASLVGAAALVSPAPIELAMASAFIATFAHAVDLPVHCALQGDVQPEEHLERGLSFGSAGFHTAALLAPVATLPLAAAFDPSMPLLVSALVFFAAAIPAFRIPVTPVIHAAKAHGSRDLAAALRFVAATPIVIPLTLAAMLPSVIEKVVTLLLPSLVAGDESRTFGLVLAAPEAGAIAVGLLMAARGWRFAAWIPIAGAGVYTACMVAVTGPAIALGTEAIFLSLFFAGCAKSALITSALAGMQRTVPAPLRGRIMSI